MDRVYKTLKAQRMIASNNGETASKAWTDDETSKSVGIRAGDTTNEIEKQFLLTVERGEIQRTKRYLDSLVKSGEKTFDINCVDPLGR